jgi:hypothetical protein
VHAGVIYSRVGDRSTSSAACATKQAAEFLWKKRFGLVGSDDFKVTKRLSNIDNWYSPDEYRTFYNREYGDIEIRRDDNYDLEVRITEGSGDTATWVMDFPYLFSNISNWSWRKEEIARRAKWSIFLNGRPLDMSFFGVQASRQIYYHIEPETYWVKGLGIRLDDKLNTVPYHAYIQNSVEFLAHKLFFSLQYYRDDGERIHDLAFSVIPVFESKQEHAEFMRYIEMNSCEFSSAVNNMDINEVFPTYARSADTVVVYKLGKALVQWLDRWRCENGKARKYTR